MSSKGHRSVIKKENADDRCNYGKKYDSEIAGFKTVNASKIKFVIVDPNENLYLLRGRTRKKETYVFVSE